LLTLQILEIGLDGAQLGINLFEQSDDLGQVGELLAGRAGDTDCRQSPAGDQFADLLADARNDPAPELAGRAAPGGGGGVGAGLVTSVGGIGSSASAPPALAFNRRPTASAALNGLVRRRLRVRLVMVDSCC
jgi:hypothetical protein